MNYDVVLTCAVTGAGDTSGKSPHVPVTPKEIADAAIEAAKAGASIAHIHARDPETGQGSRDPKLFKEIVDSNRLLRPLIEGEPVKSVFRNVADFNSFINQKGKPN